MLKKIKKIRMTPWNKRTRGEKFLTMLMSLVKWAAIIALVVSIGSVILAVVAGFGIALAIGGAIGGGFHNAGKAYHTGDRFYNDRDIW